MYHFDFPSDMTVFKSFENIESLKQEVKRSIKQIQDPYILVAYTFSSYPKSNIKHIVAKCTRCSSNLKYTYSEKTRMF